MQNFEHIASTITTNAFGEKFLYAINGKLFFNTDSKTIFANKFGRDFIKENSLYVITGIDSGLLVQFISKQSIPSGTKIVFVDFEEILEWAQEKQALFKHENISFTTQDKLKDHLASIDIDKYIYLNKLFHIPSFSVIDNNYAGYAALEKQVTELLYDLQWTTSAQLNNRLFIVNQLKNLPDNVLHASFLFGQFRGQSALLLAGGPSLDTFIPWIQKHREEYVVIAVSRISRRLIQANITPDIVFSVDPQEISFDLSREMFHFADRSVFLYSYHVFPPMVAQWPGKKAFLGPLFPWASALNRPDRATGGVTVTNIALACALEMGFSQIVLCGVDLCYSQEGHTHASCSKNRDEGPVIEGAETKIETNAGTLADTTRAYEVAARHIASLAQQEMAQHCRIVNPNLHAAKMEGVLYRPIESIESTRKDNDNTLKAFSFAENREEHLTKITKELSKIKNFLHEIIALSKKAIKENEIFFQGKINASKKSKNIIDSIESKLHSDRLIETTNFAKKFGIEQFLKIIHTKNIEEITDKEAKNNIKNYYNAFIISSNSIIKLLNDILSNIDIRQKELKFNPDCVRILTNYKNNNIPGRYKVILKNIADNQSNEVKELIIELEGTFEKYIQGELNYSEVYATKWNDWTEEREKKFITKLLELLKSKSENELIGILKLIETTDFGSSTHLELFSKGLLKEIQNDYSKAITYYNQLIDSAEDITPYLLEVTLKRIASVSIAGNDHENGLLALQCLNDLSVAYAPQYAKLLKLTDHPHDALDVYARYIEQFPYDTKTMLEMAALYGELAIPEGVMLLTEHILEREPDNITARQLRASHAE